MCNMLFTKKSVLIFTTDQEAQKQNEGTLLSLILNNCEQICFKKLNRKHPKSAFIFFYIYSNLKCLHCI